MHGYISAVRAVSLAILSLAQLGHGISTDNPDRSMTPRPRHGAVVSEVAECSDIGTDMLKIGGSAADAIIATGLCVGTIGAFHSGIGGGGFMVVRSKKGRRPPSYETIDFRETMPAQGHETMYKDNPDPTASTIGGLAVGVPGELRGWEALHRRHGKLPWKTLFKPAIKLARDGFRVNVDLADALGSRYSFLSQDPLFAESYAPNGTVLGLGDICYRKRFAKTLETIAKKGPNAFYHGTIAKNIASASQSRNGILTTDDLAGYTALIKKPARVSYKDKYAIFSTVAPSSGSIVLAILKMFERFLPANNDISTHQLLQSTRFRYSVRTNFGDPAFTENVTTIEQAALTEPFAEAATSLIDNVTHPAEYYQLPNFYNISGYTSLNEGGTSYMAAVDRWGGAVSLTTTINLYWGSRVMTEDGIILNNEMDDFSSPGSSNSFGFPASPINFIRPGKRPQSSISSTIVEHIESGEFIMATGSAGGSRIITATLQQLHNHLDLGMTATESQYTPRWHDQLTNVTYYEVDNSHGIPHFLPSALEQLSERGYSLTSQGTSGSTSHIIIKRRGEFDAAADPRKAAGGASVY